MTITDYQPLRVVATLRSQVMLERWPCLDGILGATVAEDPELRDRARAARRYSFYLENCRKHGRAATDEWYANSPKYGAIPDPVWSGHFLPLDVFGHGVEHALWVYCASAARPVGAFEMDTVHFTKRIDWLAAADYVRPADKNINVGKGEFTAKYIPYQTIAVEALEWRVRGLREEVQAILDVTYSIAKKRRRGYGFIQQWTVEPVELDESVFDRDGNLTRPVPAELLERLDIAGDFDYEYTTYRPPYWRTDYAARCAVRGQRNN